MSCFSSFLTRITIATITAMKMFSSSTNSLLQNNNPPNILPQFLPNRNRPNMQSPDPVSSPQSAQFSQFGYFLFSATNLVLPSTSWPACMIAKKEEVYYIIQMVVGIGQSYQKCHLASNIHRNRRKSLSPNCVWHAFHESIH